VRRNGRRAAASTTMALIGALLVACSAGAAPGCQSDPLTARSLTQLSSFSDWLRTHGVRGAVGEVGWPGGGQWESLARQWYTRADEDQVGAFAWSAAQWWPASYPLGIYRGAQVTNQSSTPFLAGDQARVVESHPPLDGVARGVSVSDGTFGSSLGDDSTYSSTNRGVYGSNYSYPSAPFLQYLASRGITQIRMSVMWERVQPVLGDPLDPTEVARLTQSLDDAASAGLSVVLDLHNYGRYAAGSADGSRHVLVLGSPNLPNSALDDVWRRIVTAVAGRPIVVGYGIMNEPHDLPGGAVTWEAASFSAVAAIRESNRTTPIYVGGYAYSKISTFTTEHPRPWIDPRNWPVVYEAHQYFDTTGTGFYKDPYTTTNTAAVAKGWTACSTAADRPAS